MVANMTKHDGLDASGFLLLAEGHLVKASEVLKKEEPSSARREARWAIVDAGNDIRRALNLLKEEELCKP